MKLLAFVGIHFFSHSDSTVSFTFSTWHGWIILLYVYYQYSTVMAHTSFQFSVFFFSKIGTFSKVLPSTSVCTGLVKPINWPVLERGRVQCEITDNLEVCSKYYLYSCLYHGIFHIYFHCALIQKPNITDARLLCLCILFDITLYAHLLSDHLVPGKNR